MNLSLFSHSDFGQVRATLEDGRPLFVARDMATALGYTNPMEAIRTHCKGVSEILTPSAGGVQAMKWIPESDVYRLIMRSKLPSAERFQDWVCEEVLPAIRANGSYVLSGRPFSLADDVAAKLAAFTIQSEDGARAYRILCDLYADVTGTRPIGSEPAACDDRHTLIADLTVLIESIVEEYGSDAIIIPARDILGEIHRRNLLKWIFPTPADPFWHDSKAEQSRFGKFLRRELVGKEFRTRLGSVRIMRGPSSRHSLVAFICQGKEAA